MNTAVTAPSGTPNLVDRVYEFNRIGQVTPPGHFNADRVGFYTGMQLEEMAETLEAIAAGHVDVLARIRLREFATAMDALGKEFKAGKHYGAVLRADREELLDGAIDVLVVTTGSMIYQTPKYARAIAAVLDANDAKFPDGVAIRDANNKICKPPSWVAPNLQPFVDQPIE